MHEVKKRQALMVGGLIYIKHREQAQRQVANRDERLFPTDKNLDRDSRCTEKPSIDS